MPPAEREAACTRAESADRFRSLRSLPGNDKCVECHAPDTSWVVLDHGVLVCLHCAGAHRGLGTHISKVRSSQHDQFTPSEFEWLAAGGNAKSAALYEGALPPTVRRPLLPLRRGGACLRASKCHSAGRRPLAAGRQKRDREAKAPPAPKPGCRGTVPCGTSRADPQSLFGARPFALLAAIASGAGSRGGRL